MCARIARCDCIKRQDVLNTLGLLDMFIESSSLLHKHLHLLGGEGTLEHALVIISPLTEPSVKFGGKVKRAVGEVGHVMEVCCLQKYWSGHTSTSSLSGFGPS